MERLEERVWDEERVEALEEYWSKAPSKLRVECILPSFIVGTSVLDAGCGTGRLTKDLGELRYVGIDSSRAMISSARRRTKNLCLGDVTSLPFSDQSFDTVLSSDVLLHLTDEETQRALAEFCRIAKRRVVATFQKGSSYDFHPTFFTRQHRIDKISSWLPPQYKPHFLRLYKRNHTMIAERWTP